MAIVELYEEQQLHDIVAVNGELHVIVTVFDNRTYQTQSLKEFIEDNTVLHFGDDNVLTVTEFIDILMQEAVKNGRVNIDTKNTEKEV